MCGEFLSPGAPEWLAQLGVWNRILELRPTRYQRLGLYFRRARKQCRLPEAGWGLSRYALDRILWERAIELGVRFHAERTRTAAIIATGRSRITAARPRLFGFKAHFRGPVSDSVDLYFDGPAYVGVNSVENGITNVCGLAPENLLSQYRFDPEPLLAGEALRDRLRNHERVMDWLITGPVVYGRPAFPPVLPLPVGDALSFVDPFTGTGLLNALFTGWQAGAICAQGKSAESYTRVCREAMGLCFQSARLIRAALERGWAESLLPFAPARLLLRTTRPAVRPK